MGHQHRPSMAGKQGSKAVPAAAASIYSLPSLTLPPSINLLALSSLVRLPVDNECTVHWERHDSKSADGAARQAACDALMELSMAESEAVRGEDRQSLLGHTLWAIEHDYSSGIKQATIEAPSVLAAIWTFQVKKETETNVLSASTASEQQKRAGECKVVAHGRLAALDPQAQVGHCRLKDFYPSAAPDVTNDRSVLTPKDYYARQLRFFLCALQEHFLSRWVWTNSLADEPAKKSSPDPGAKLAETHTEGGTELGVEKEMEGVREVDEEEEGAIEDGTSPVLPLFSSNKLEYWSNDRRNHRGELSRLGRDVVLHPPALFSKLFEQNRQVDRQAQRFTLRCFLNNEGHIFLETRPQAADSLEHIGDSDDVIDQEATLGPIGFRATLVERLRGLQWPDGRESKKDVGDDKDQLLECKNSLLKMLQVRGVHVEKLGDDWMVCESDEKRRFLWPSKLCFVQPKSGGVRQSRSRSRGSLRFAKRPLQDVAQRARGLVRESLGLRNADEEGEGVMLDSEDEEGGSGEPGHMEDDGDDDDDDRGQSDDSGGGVKRDAETETAQPDKVNGAKMANLDTFLPGQAARAISPEADKRTSAGREEDEPDLWGTFGFGPQDDDEGKESHRRQSAAGLDESAFGLITEDDFSFFDEAARAAGPFDDLGDDVTMQEGREQGDDATALVGESVFSPDVAMTGSTFVDPPSLPAFTPGSLSATSPAVGGLNAKTPRTPFSPNQDIVDANVAIEGESDSLFHSVGRFVHHHRHDHEPTISMPALEEDHMESSTDGSSEILRTSKQAWSRQSRGDLTSKYEQGKFALPLTPSRRRGEATDVAENGSDDKDTGVHPRSRLGRRFSHSRRLSSSKTLLQYVGQSRKLRLGPLSLRVEEDVSDVEATVEGTISERSSLMDEDSSKDDSSTSGDASEVDEGVYQDRLDLLFSARSILGVMPPTDLGTIPVAHAVPLSEGQAPVDPYKSVDVNTSLRLLTDNPQMLHAIFSAPKETGETCSRSTSRELFRPLPFDTEQTTLANLLQDADTIEVLEPPEVMLGCQGAIASMQPSALPFWEKLGLSAVSGPKSVVALALHCSSLPATWQKELLNWFTELGWTYRKMGLGSHVLASDGLLALGSLQTLSIAQTLSQIALHAEQWMDTLDSLLSRIQLDLQANKFVVIYVLGSHIHPSTLWALTKLESDLRVLAKKRWRSAPELLNVRPYTWATIASSLSALGDGVSNMRRLALSIYDSLLVPVSPWQNHKSHLPRVHESPSVGTHHPSFTIAPRDHLSRLTTRFQLQWNAEAYNLTDSGLLLHVAYRLANSVGEMSFVSVMDEKAQGYRVYGWARKGTLMDEIDKVWEQVQDSARQARILWRIVICSDEQVSMDEVDRWSMLLNEPQSSLRALDVSLACVDAFTPFALVTPRSAPTESLLPVVGHGQTERVTEEKTMHYLDASQADYAIYPPFRMSLCGDASGILPLQSAVKVSVSSTYNGSIALTSPGTPICSNGPHTAPSHFWLHILQVYQTPFSTHSDPLSLRKRIQTIITSFHHLTFIAKERSLLRDNRPWHLAILTAIARTSKAL